MIKYQEIILNDEVIKDLIHLSKLWVLENNCYGMVENTIDDLKETGFLAYDDERLVGYIFGSFYNNEKKTSYIEVGKKCFEISELYVIKEYRHLGIGRHLFKLLEDKIKLDKEVKYLTLATSNKDYESILKFYCEDNDMNFHSAFLIKNLN